MSSLTTDALSSRVAARLDHRLQSNRQAPVALALSGGGDSLALLRLAADWAKQAGRGLVTITVDHGLNPASPEWSVFCREAAQSVGAHWVEAHWQGDKPTTGLSAAARLARHRLIADAARQVGARVILFAHTADDIREADWLRQRGATLGQLREWGPSPVWPEGRDLMILRPLLNETRDTLRTYLKRHGQTWIEDPANLDVRFGRSRARQDLDRSTAELARLERGPPGPLLATQADLEVRAPTQATSALAHAVVGPDVPSLGRVGVAPVALDLGAGFSVGRAIAANTLAKVCVCASGNTEPPRGQRLARLRERLASGQDFTATLVGARIVARGDQVLIGREAGEGRRKPVAPSALMPDVASIWDGRYAVTVDEPGWRVVAGAGRLNRLSDVDRAILYRLPVWARPTLPVLIRDDESAPILAWRGAEVLALAPRRLRLSLSGLLAGTEDETTQESGLDVMIHGEMPPPDLF